VSYTNPSRTVLGEITRCLPATLVLSTASLVFVIVLSLPIGFFCAVYKDSLFDRVVRGIVFMTTAMPAYWIGLLLIWLVSIKWDLLPTSGSGTLWHLILPSFTVSLTYISTYIRLIRNNMLENMKEDYVLYANARGLRQRNILIRHILKNSLHTCIVAIGMSVPQLMAGTIVVENVFAWPGLGKLCITSIFNRDYPVIQTYVLLIGFLFVVFNLLFDIIQCIADPRLQREVS
jgi:nickel transport system permease protein